MVYGQNTSSRTYEYIISKDTTVQDISTSSRTYAYLMSTSYSTMPTIHQHDTHFHSNRSWDSFPYRPWRRHQQATTSYSLQQPQKLRLLLPPGQRRRHQQVSQRTKPYSSEVTNRVSSQEDQRHR